MKRYALLTVTLMTFATVLAGCGMDQPANQAPPAAPAVAAKPPAAKAPPAEATALAVPEAPFAYQAEGRRDPFLPLLAFKGKSSRGREFDNPLEAYDLLQYQLKGVIIGLGEPKALVVAPDGKTYILRKGLRIGKSNGIIRDISRERILVEERYQDVSGATRTNIQEILVPKREGV
jgi:type IV pilus assembly protein PilP